MDRELCRKHCATARDINSAVLSGIEVPASFRASLPANAKPVLGGDLHREMLHSRSCDIQAFVARHGVTPENVCAVLSKLEKANIIWRNKNTSDVKAVNAQLYVSQLRQAFPGAGQTELEKAKIGANKDVGCAVLEAYSRCLESRAASILSRIEDVIKADNQAKIAAGGALGMA